MPVCGSSVCASSQASTSRLGEEKLAGSARERDRSARDHLVDRALLDTQVIGHLRRRHQR